ncbi:MAG TPA: tetratricopeptide repeat protein [Nitrospirota bacterium]|nr:tetratricopeptide repeat protein [Nitrospirota bacterium]
MSPDASHRKREVTFPLLLAGVIVLSYFNALLNQFVWDDIFLVVKNPFTKDWGSLGDIFTTGYWASRGETRGLYRPLTILSFLVEYSLAGLRPFLYHLDNLILHFLCSWLVYKVLGRVFGKGPVPIFAALLFAAHPVHVEAVAWVSGRAELLAAFFLLLSLYLYQKGPDRPGNVLASALFFFLGLLSKESAAVLPVLLAAYTPLFEKGYSEIPSPRAKTLLLARRLYPYAVAFILYLPLRLNALPGTLIPVKSEQALKELTPYQTFLLMCEAFTHYIRLSFFPVSLSADYLFPPPFSFLEFGAFFPVLVLLLLAVFSRRLLSRSRPLFFAAAWFFVTLLPVSNIIPTGLYMSERAMYLPSLSACMLLGAGFAAVFGILPVNGNKARMMVAALPLLATLAFFSAGTINRNPYWRSQKEFEKNLSQFYLNWIRRFPLYAPAYAKLAVHYGFYYGDYGPRTEALARKALELDPEDHWAHYAMAHIYDHRGMTEEALRELDLSLAEKPDFSDAYNLRGTMLYRQGKYEEAERMFDLALKYNQESAANNANKGLVLMTRGDWETAFSFFQRAIELDPDNFEAHLQSGVILGSKERYDEALGHLRRAAGLKNSDPTAHYYLAAALYATGRLEEAEMELATALELRPDYAEASDLLKKLR